MGFDLYGVNPKIKEGTKKPEEIDWKTSTEEEKEEYFKAVDEYESINKGVYFRNNVWWWRRLADYVMEHTKCIDRKDFDKWQHNDGHEVDDKDGISAAIVIAQLIDELKQQGKTFDDYLDEIGKEFGFYFTDQISIRFTDLKQIAVLFKRTLDNPPKEILGAKLESLENLSESKD